jgi:hypothetical protein
MWTFSQSLGQLVDSTGVIVGRGWAGQGEGKNNPSLQTVPKVGPLPQGTYTINPPHDSSHTGPYTMDLTPDPSNEMFGRSEFRIHGASKSNPELSSEGCIVMPPAVRKAIWASSDHSIQVVA